MRSSDSERIYQSLDAAGHQIRLLRVRPQPAAGATRQISLSVFRLEEAPSYRALSYKWDHSANLEDILTNNVISQIPQNVCRFLDLFLQRHSSNEYLWIDQICIDQTNQAEKNSQVAMMSNIYSRAAEVIIWLWIPDVVDDSPTDDCVIKAANIVRHSNYKVGDDQQVADLRMLTRHPYWQRTWIVQELLLAQELQIYFGNAEPILWESFIDFFGEDRKYMRLNFFAREAPGQFWIEKVSLQTIINHVKRTICQDPRDKWYGMQGLLDDKYRTVVDYGREVEEVFLDASIAIMKQTKSWDFLEDLLDLAKGMEILSGDGKETNWFSWLDRRDELDAGVLAKVIIQLKKGDDAFESLIKAQLNKLLRTEHTAKAPFQGLYTACADYVANRDELNHERTGFVDLLAHMGLDQ